MGVVEDPPYPTANKALTIALAGNPNCGKSALFNALTGIRQKTGNGPGVTVERKEGRMELDGLSLTVIDLPGIYSLDAGSPDERVTRDFLLSREADLIVNVLDASNLERNLYLTTQLLELRRPVLFALNMMDDAERQGTSLDLAALERLLGGPVIPTVGNREEGLDRLQRALLEVSRGDDPRLREIPVGYENDIEKELARLANEIQRDERLAAALPPR